MRRLVAAVAVSAVLASTASAEARLPGCNSKVCELRVAAKACKRSEPVACFTRASLLHRVPRSLLLRIARCESTMRWWVVSSAGAMGPMQFMPGTWRSTPYRSHSPFSFKWSPIAAAWLIRTDGVHHWNPSRHCWGR
jgi:soluble lytic murein transglycosylase-like protein